VLHNIHTIFTFVPLMLNISCLRNMTCTFYILYYVSHVELRSVNS